MSQEIERYSTMSKKMTIPASILHYHFLVSTTKLDRKQGFTVVLHPKLTRLCLLINVNKNNIFNLSFNTFQSLYIFPQK